MQDIYIIVSYTGTYFSNFLRLMTKEKYVHVSVSLDNNLSEVYSFGRKNPKWMFPCGFVMEDMQLITKLFKESICKIYKLQITEKQYHNLKKELKRYIDCKNDYHYNIKGLIHIKLNKVYHRKYHFVCSQFVGKLLQDSSIYDFKKDYSIINPYDISHIKKADLFYEEKIIDYLKELDYVKN